MPHGMYIFDSFTIQDWYATICFRNKCIYFSYKELDSIIFSIQNNKLNIFTEMNQAIENSHDCDIL